MRNKSDARSINTPILCTYVSLKHKLTHNAQTLIRIVVSSTLIGQPNGM
jgi:hypothetical protein